MSYTFSTMLLLAPFEKPLAPPGERRGTSWAMGDGGLLPLLLIVAVLLCHGLLGAAHQVSCHSCEAAQPETVHHGSVTGTGADDGGDAMGSQADGLGGTAYAAVMIAALGVALLGLIGTVRVRTVAPIPRAPWWRLFPSVSRHLRGPSLPSLQVFRL